MTKRTGSFRSLSSRIPEMPLILSPLTSSAIFLDDAVASLLVGDFGDHDPCAVSFHLFDSAAPAKQNRAAAGLVAAPNAGATANDSAGREVGSGNDLDQLIDW